MTERFPIVDPRPLTMTLAQRVVLTPIFVRITLTGDDLRGFECAPGQDLMLAVPHRDGDGTINRRYTVRYAHGDDARVDLDVVVHDDGPGARWASDAPLGSEITALGPRGKIVPVADVDWHLFACDESGWPATAAMVEALEPGEVAIVLAETAGPDEHQPLESRAALRLVRSDRGARAPGDPQPLTDALRDLELPPGRGHAYLSAEAAVVRGLREALMTRGLTHDDVSLKAYWRRDQANAAHGEPLRDAV
jgi:NADPH-dependent ferric siderophore reductase